MVKPVGLPSRRYSAIGHRRLPLAAPVGEDVLRGLPGLLPLREGAQALDLGCGRGALLLLLAEQAGVEALGVDTDELALDDARAAMRGRNLSGRIEFRKLAALDLPEHHMADLGICVGASHACGGYGKTLDFLQVRTRPGGFLLIGEGYWKKPPPADYLSFLGAAADDLNTHHGNTARAAERGLVCVWSFVSREADWDRYEGLYRLAMHEWLSAHPRDPDHDAFAERSARWYDGYLRWGRDTLGFALYLFAVPARPDRGTA